MQSSAWRPGIPGELITLLKEAEANSQRLNAILSASCNKGWTLQELADVFGVSREAIRQRVAKPLLAEYVAEVSDQVPDKPPRPTAPPKERVRQPIEFVPPEMIEELSRLREASAGTNGGTPVGDPRRAAGDEFCSLADRVKREYGVTNYALAKALGVGTRAIVVRLAARGYQKDAHVAPYKNRPKLGWRKPAAA